MASGDVVGAILQSLPPGATRADPGIRAGGSTPGENWPVIRFDDSVDEYWDFLCALESPYQAGTSTGITIQLPWTWPDTGTTGNVEWNASIRRVQDDVTDLDAAFTYTTNAQTVVDAAASASGEVSYASIAFTDGAQMNSTAQGERFMLRIWRDASIGGDLTGDAELLWPGIVIRET